MHIVSGPPVYLRKKVSYQGHAICIYSVEQVTSIVDYIGRHVDSDDALPFAVRLVENGELIVMSDDNGEFATGEILSRSLKKIEGYNVMVCVSRNVKGSYVTDILQPQKLHAIKDAADKVINLLQIHLLGEQYLAEERKRIEVEEAERAKLPPDPHTFRLPSFDTSTNITMFDNLNITGSEDFNPAHIVLKPTPRIKAPTKGRK